MSENSNGHTPSFNTNLMLFYGLVHSICSATKAAEFALLKENNRMEMPVSHFTFFMVDCKTSQIVHIAVPLQLPAVMEATYKKLPSALLTCLRAECECLRALFNVWDQKTFTSSANSPFPLSTSQDRGMKIKLWWHLCFCIFSIF